MSLLGVPLLITLGALALLLPVLALLAWSRVRGNSALRSAQRLGLVLTCQLAALTVAAAGLNDYGYFFTSWSQLLGQDHVRVHGISAQTARLPLSVPGNPDEVDAIPIGHGSLRELRRSGRLDSIEIAGQHSKLIQPALVYLPPQVFRPGERGVRFPGIEILTGYPGSDVTLERRLQAPQVMEKLLAEHHAKPAILVLLRASVAPPRDTECTNIYRGPQALTFFGVDVPQVISHAYPARATGWGVTGYSTGGYCASKIAMTHPQTFTAAASMSGYYAADHDSTTGDLWGGSQARQNLDDLSWRLQHLPAPAISLLLCSSPTEHGYEGYSAAQNFLKLVRTPMTGELLSVSNGSHTFSTWSRELPSVFEWFSRQLN